MCIRLLLLCRLYSWHHIFSIEFEQCSWRNRQDRWKDKQMIRIVAKPHHQDRFRSSLCISVSKEKCLEWTWSMRYYGLQTQSEGSTHSRYEQPDQFQQEWQCLRYRLVSFWLHQSKFITFFHQRLSKNCMHWVERRLYDGWIRGLRIRIWLLMKRWTSQSWLIQRCCKWGLKRRYWTLRKGLSLWWGFLSRKCPDGWTCRWSTWNIRWGFGHRQCLECTDPWPRNYWNLNQALSKIDKLYMSWGHLLWYRIQLCMKSDRILWAHRHSTRNFVRIQLDILQNRWWIQLEGNNLCRIQCIKKWFPQNTGHILWDKWYHRLPHYWSHSVDSSCPTYCSCTLYKCDSRF